MSEIVLKTCLECDKLISVNKRLWGSATRGMRHSWDYEHEQSQLRESLKRHGIQEGCLGNSSLYSVIYALYLKENISRRDTDNLIKSVTDVLSKYLGFNDNKIVSYRFSKREVRDAEKEHVLVIIEKMDGWWDDLRMTKEEFEGFLEEYLEKN